MSYLKVCIILLYIYVFLQQLKWTLYLIRCIKKSERECEHSSFHNDSPKKRRLFIHRPRDRGIKYFINLHLYIKLVKVNEKRVVKSRLCCESLKYIFSKQPVPNLHFPYFSVFDLSSEGDERRHCFLQRKWC